MHSNLKKQIKQSFKQAKDKIEFLNELRKFIHNLNPIQQPVDMIYWVPIEMVEPNNYNPNQVANVEMRLLYKSIKHDGYTQPIVTIWNPKKQKWIIVDGFHRYYVCKTQKDIYEQNHGLIPIVVIEKSINEQMAATVRHNRARGEHTIQGMSNIVFKMLDGGWADDEICNQLGLEAEELLKLKHITGFSKLFQDYKYQKAWETKRQVKLRQEYANKNSTSAS